MNLDAEVTIVPAGEKLMDRTSFQVLNDAPVGEGGVRDLLDTENVASGLAALIRDSRESAPFTLAVDAEWGMGKSSLLRAIDANLRNGGNVSTVWFNAWMSERAEAVEGLIKSVLHSFDGNIIRRTVRGVLRRRHLVGAIRVISLVASSFFGIGKVVDSVWKALEADGKTRNDIKAVVREMAGAWMAKGDGVGSRLLVVFVDDLDRCSPGRVLEVLETIKLYLDIPGFVFVLACDLGVIGREIGGSAEGSDILYLEKIVQVTYPVSPPSEELTINLVKEYLKTSRAGDLFDEEMIKMLIERTGRNPRRIKRLINRFVLEYRLGRGGWQEKAPDSLIRLIVLQHFHPIFCSLVTGPAGEQQEKLFAAYNEFRTSVNSGASRDAAEWKALFDQAHVRVPERTLSNDDLHTLLTEVATALPPCFDRLARDEASMGLFKSLRSKPEVWQRILTNGIPVNWAPVPGLDTPHSPQGDSSGADLRRFFSLAARLEELPYAQRRELAASEVRDVAGRLPLDSLLDFTHSARKGERVAALIGIKVQMIAREPARHEPAVRWALRSGVTDGSSLVRYRVAEILFHCTDVADTMPGELQSLMKDQNHDVRAKASAAWKRVQELSERRRSEDGE